MTYLASDSLEGRATGAPGYELAAGYVVERMQSIGLEPAGEDGWFQPFVVRQATSIERASKTLITRGNEQFELQPTADRGGLGAPVDGDGIYNGALDNASGVAVMLEAARILANADPPPRRSILFIATGAEELGLLGSRHFAISPTVPGESLVATVNIDMPVALYPAEGMIPVPSRHPERSLFTYPDQYSFVREAIPSLYIHDAPLSADPSIDAQASGRRGCQTAFSAAASQVTLESKKARSRTNGPCSPQLA